VRPMEVPGRPRAAFDDRSANLQRTSGWERYSRSLLHALAGRVQPLGLAAPTMRRRVETDWVTLPGARRRSGLWTVPLHLPTYPPTPLLRGPLVWTVHDLTWWFYPETSSAAGRAYYRPLASLALRRRDITWVTPSHQVRREMLERFPLSPEAVVATPLGVSALPASEPYTADRPYILSVGTLEPRKNIGLLLEAYARSAVRLTHDLRLIGRPGWGVELPTDVILMTSVDDRALSALYRGADALVSPSIYEGFGLPLIEAMSVGLPVLCSDIPVYREVTGGLAQYFSVATSDALVDLLDALGDDSEVERERRRRWAARFTWEACAESTLTAYKRAAGA
jgi:glycosyltransferase involved in cell wall biosynthesis